MEDPIFRWEGGNRCPSYSFVYLIEILTSLPDFLKKFCWDVLFKWSNSIWGGDKNTFLLRNILAKEGNEEVMDGKGCLVNIQIYPIRKCKFSFKTHTKKGFLRKNKIKIK